VHAETFPLSKYIIHEDDSLVVINKPAGLLSIPHGYESETPNLSQILKTYYGDIWTVHRLDRESSGVIIFARTAQAHRVLSMQFEKRQTHKIYHAIVYPTPTWEEKTVHSPLRANTGRKHLTRVDHHHGKPAQTTFRVLERFNHLVLLEAHPMTGYRHQIRAHLYAIGMNIIGDPLYSIVETKGNQAPSADRMMLHAFQLTLQHPTSGNTVTYTAHYPNDFDLTLQRIRKTEL
jgi:RluA family pseudouridine synthase